MTREAMVALRADREEAVKIFGSLSAEEWALASGCDGWSVQDLVAHMAATFHPTWSLIKGSLVTKDFEALNDDLVDERRELTAAEQLDEYETWSRRALRVLDVAQRRPISAIPVRLGDLGSHPMHFLANAAAFDHYTHLRVDLIAPLGPIERDPLPADPLRLRPVMEWMHRLFPTLCSECLEWLADPIGLRLHGPGGGEWTIAPARPAGEGLSLDPGIDDAVAAVAVSTTADYVVWGTKRRDWRDLGVEIEGDEELVARALDAIRIF